MSDFFGLDSAIGWAHFRLRNGWKTPLIGAAAYAVLLTVILIVSVQADTHRRVQTLSAWRGILLFIQSVILIFMGGSRINSAIRSDITLRLVESHRMMPLSPLRAVSGYFWGPNVLTLALAAVGFLAGIFAVEAASLDLAGWVVANAVLLSFAIFCWTVIALGASQSRAAGLLVFIGLALLTVAAGPVLSIAPAAVLLNGPMLGQTIFDPTFDFTRRGTILVASSAAQLCIGATLLIGVARRFRWPAKPALATLPALALLVFWLAASMFTIDQSELIRPQYVRISDNSMLAASLLSCMLLAVLPISNTVRSPTAYRAAPWISLACAAIIAVLFCQVDLPPNRFFPTVGQAAVVLVSYCLGVCFLLQRFRGWRMINSMLIVWLLLTWLGPIIIDFVRWLGTDSNYGFQPSPIIAISPVGLLVALFNETNLNLVPGLIAQVALAAMTAILLQLKPRMQTALIAEATAA